MSHQFYCITMKLDDDQRKSLVASIKYYIKKPILFLSIGLAILQLSCQQKIYVDVIYVFAIFGQHSRYECTCCHFFSFINRFFPVLIYYCHLDAPHSFITSAANTSAAKGTHQ